MTPHPDHPSRPAMLGRFASLGAGGLAAIAFAGCGPASVAVSNAGPGRILAVGAENQYANVISQIGGRYVAVAAIMSNPNTDPHSFEASPSVAHVVSSAKLVVQNGVGYDAFMNKIEAASPNAARQVIAVQNLLGLPTSTANPHLWYKPATMPAVAAALVKDLSKVDPAHAAYFAANARRFEASLRPWFAALKALKTEFPHTPVATTEPVGDYMLAAAGARIRTPWELQADIMNGVDPAPQDISLQDYLLSDHRVKVFLYNQQVTDSLTQSFLKTAAAGHVPVVGVYETMPLHYSYQSWMLAEVRALRSAIVDGKSTRRL